LCHIVALFKTNDDDQFCINDFAISPVMRHSTLRILKNQILVCTTTYIEQGNILYNTLFIFIFILDI